MQPGGFRRAIKGDEKWDERVRLFAFRAAETARREKEKEEEREKVERRKVGERERAKAIPSEWK